MKRGVLVDGEACDAFLHSQAYPRAVSRDFRHLLIFRDKCISRFDYAPEVDGRHINDLSAPSGYPLGVVGPCHFHDWEGNKHMATASSLPDKLKIAREVEMPALEIDNAFWWFCHQVGITATTTDTPGWPPADRLL